MIKLCKKTAGASGPGSLRVGSGEPTIARGRGVSLTSPGKSLDGHRKKIYE
mgnify:CR=1 FL=1